MKKISEEFFGKYSIIIGAWPETSSPRTIMCKSCIEGMTSDKKADPKKSEKKTILIKFVGPYNEDVTNIASADKFEAIMKLREASSLLISGQSELAEEKIKKFFQK